MKEIGTLKQESVKVIHKETKLDGLKPEIIFKEQFEKASELLNSLLENEENIQKLKD